MATQRAFSDKVRTYSKWCFAKSRITLSVVESYNTVGKETFN